MNASGQTVEEWECAGGCSNWWGELGVKQNKCPQCGWSCTRRTGVGTHIKWVDTETAQVETSEAVGPARVVPWVERQVETVYRFGEVSMTTEARVQEV